MPFTLEAADEVVRLRFSGDLDISRYPEVCDAVRWAEATHRPILLALDETVQYIDSITLSELLLFKRRLERNEVPVATWVASGRVFVLLTITDVAERLNATTSEGHALTILRRMHVRKG